MHAITLALLSLAATAAPPVHADDGMSACMPQPPDTVRNGDGSLLSIQLLCPSPGMRRHVLSLTDAAGTLLDRLEIAQSIDEAPTGHAAMRDLDGDGWHEVEIRGQCGAGPNCEGDVYRIDRDAGRLVHFFGGGYSDLSVHDGWLVSSGRASCCSWEFGLWPLDAGAALPLGDDGTAPAFTATVDAAGDDDGHVTGVTCAFHRGDNRQPTAPPAPALEALCRHYDAPYELVTPSGAQAPRQEP